MPRLTPLRPIALAVVLSACHGIDLSSSDSEDPFDQANMLMTTVGSAALSIGTTALLTDSERSGRPLSDRREIALAIARGSGPFVDDLAGWLQLPPVLVPVLGEALRDARPVLQPALDAPLTVQSFETLLAVMLCRHGQLRYHAWKRFDCQRVAPLSAP